MDPIARPCVALLRQTDHVFRLVTSDLDDDTARRRHRGDAGPSVAHTIGHLLHFRSVMLRLLGHDGESRWQRFVGDATDGADYPTMAELRRDWADVSARLLAAFEAATDDYLLATAPAVGDGEAPRLQSLTTLLWHEGYHMGQIGTVRATFGLATTAELANAARHRPPADDTV